MRTANDYGHAQSGTRLRNCCGVLSLLAANFERSGSWQHASTELLACRNDYGFIRLV
jgi:hypothetical protein